MLCLSWNAKNVTFCTYVGKAETKYAMGLNNYESAHKSLQIRMEENRNNVIDIKYKTIMKGVF